MFSKINQQQNKKGNPTQPFIQPKLSIGQPGDAYEREADAVAEKVIQKKEIGTIKPITSGAIQQKCDACEKEDKVQKKEDDDLQAKADALVVPSASFETSLKDESSNGKPLEPGIKGDMEKSFNNNFNNVRVHTNERAIQMNREINAQAFTHGNHIYFNENKYNPSSSNGQRLLAHELTHTIQQKGQKKIQRNTLENDPADAPPMTCAIANSSPEGDSMDVLFNTGSANLTASDKSALSNFAANWHAAGGTDPVRIDGFSSIDGSPGTNWQLSCNRAEMVAQELMTPSDGSDGIPAVFITKFANGETNQFSTSLSPNRRATIYVPSFVPPPDPCESADPSVDSWIVSNTGTTHADNCCALCPKGLGVNSDPPKYKNGIELMAVINCHDPAASYDVKRTKDARYWKEYTFLGFPYWSEDTSLRKPAGTSDDSHNRDECLVPSAHGSKHKIFSQDQPGFRSLSAGASYQRIAQVINFIEFVRITKADGTVINDTTQQRWHTKLIIEKVGGTWRIDTANSEIDTGHLATLNP